MLRTLLSLCLAAAVAMCASPCRGDPVLLKQFENLRRTDDLDGMVKRRFVRALVVYSKTFYFVDRGRERGLVAEGIKAFERHLNKTLRINNAQAYVHVVAVPVSRDQLVPWLLEGRGDIAAANLTITPEREREIDFSQPFYDNAAEILVTGPDVPVPEIVEDLSGQDVFVRKSSSAYEHLMRTNRSMRGFRRPIRIQLADDRLEDEDLLEMVNAG